ncbi:uncharacterized protein ZBAI_04870 [Zygosaccharomyces bailii ISA1307]|nr:uncharacterized protein ZBAI_04870 [Zygosaccharomyces bailii ISA1307]
MTLVANAGSLCAVSFSLSGFALAPSLPLRSLRSRMWVPGDLCRSDTHTHTHNTHKAAGFGVTHPLGAYTPAVQLATASAATTTVAVQQRHSRYGDRMRLSITWRMTHTQTRAPSSWLEGECEMS